MLLEPSVESACKLFWVSDIPYSYSNCTLPKETILHVLMLKPSSQSWLHLQSLSISSCNSFWSASNAILPYSLQSSANNLHTLPMTPDRSFIYSINKIGPRIDPCGIPDNKSVHFERLPLITTLCSLCFKKSLSYNNNDPFIQYPSSFLTNRLWGTLPNAFLKSKYTVSTCKLVSYASVQSSITVRSCKIVLLFFQNPNWLSDNKLCLDKWFITSSFVITFQKFT